MVLLEGCRPPGTSEKVMEVGMVAERLTFWVLFCLPELLALWTVKRSEGWSVLGLDGVTQEGEGGKVQRISSIDDRWKIDRGRVRIV